MSKAEASKLEQRGREIARRWDMDDFCGNISEIIFSCNLPEKTGWNVAEVALMVADGEPVEWVTGWRYGHIPADGRPSFNSFEGEHERGISLQAVEGGRETCRQSAMLYEAEAAPVVNVRGILLPFTGGDGEPLVCCAYEI